jgi:hypothetical protein
MKTKIYTDKEIEYLLKNRFVTKVFYKRAIEYSNIFKLWSVLQKIRYPEKTARDIFEEAGFNTNLMNSKLPQSRIRSWYLCYERYGFDYFISNINYSKMKDECLNKFVNNSDTLEDKIYKRVVLEIYQMMGDR